MMRIGHGYDVHCFGEGDYLILGGAKIPFNKCFVAHSDGDVLIHALCDALLGAAGLGDIGKHFPDTDEQFSGIDSRKLLRHVYSLLLSKGWKVGNADITIVAQAPKMSPYLDEMCLNLVADLDCEKSQLNIKATTTEQLGFVGRKEGIACHVVVLLMAA